MTFLRFKKIRALNESKLEILNHRKNEKLYYLRIIRDTDVRVEALCILACVYASAPKHLSCTCS